MSFHQTSRWLTALVAGALLATLPPSRGDVTTFVITNLSTFNVGTLTGQNGQLLNATNAVNFTQMTSGAVLVGSGPGGSAGGDNNSVILSNALLSANANSYIGGSSSNNTVTLLANTVWDNGGGFLTVGYNSGNTGNSLTLNGGGQANGALLTNFGGLEIGYGSSSGGNNNRLVLTNGATMGSPIASLNDVVGYLGSGNQMIVVGGSNGVTSTFMGAGTLSAAFFVGLSSAGVCSNNLLMIDTGGIVTNVGYNQYSFTIGLAQSHGTEMSNQVVVQNGGQLWAGSPTYGIAIGTGGGVGSGGNASSNSLYINNGLVNSAGPLFVGGNGLGGVTSTLNSVTVTNGGSLTSFGGTIGFGSGGFGPANFNSVTIIGTNAAGTPSVWNLSGGPLLIGGATATGNVLTVDGMGTAGGAIVSNVNGVNLGSLTFASGTGGNDRLVVTNGGQFLSAGDFVVGYGSHGGEGVVVDGGAMASAADTILSNNGLITLGGFVDNLGNSTGYNYMTVTNASVWSTGLTIGNGSSNNAVSVLGNGWWNLSGNTLTVGTGGATGNVLTINGGTVTNVGTAVIGDSVGTVGNSAGILNGGQFASSTLTVGGAAGASNNSYNVGGSGASSFVSNGIITVGSVNAGFNMLIVTNAALQSQSAIIGSGSSSNTASVLANATWSVQTLTVGSGQTGSPATNATGNSLFIAGNGQLTAGTVNVGVLAGDNHNSVLVLNGGVLSANTLTVLAGSTGNTISNRNATYQFTTATPTITPNGAGSIAINNGTIAFLGIDNADVTANQSTGALSGITFAGSNTFMLNASSNVNVSAAQDYTFQVVPGNPSNYASLVMVNGQTEYGNGNLTIGATGTLLITNTMANLDQDFVNSGIADVVTATANFNGNFVNQGTVSVVNATANLANTLNNHGRLTLQNATLNATAINFATGTIHGNGTITSDVNSLGTISPVGTLTFVGNLTLLSSSVVIMELTGYGNGVGTNDVISVGGDFQYGGKLVVTNTTGFAYAFGQEFYLFNFASGSQFDDFSVTNLPNLTPYGLAWDTSQLAMIGLLIVVPEPSAALLLVAGVLGVWWLPWRRRRIVIGRHQSEGTQERALHNSPGRARSCVPSMIMKSRLTN